MIIELFTQDKYTLILGKKMIMSNQLNDQGQTVQWPSQWFEYTKGYSEVVNLIMDNTMTKIKRIKRQTIMITCFILKYMSGELSYHYPPGITCFIPYLVGYSLILFVSFLCSVY
jgi:hypothetical protein